MDLDSVRANLATSTNANTVQIAGPGGKIINCRARIEVGGQVRVDLLLLAKALGYTVDSSEWPMVRLLQ